MIYQKSFVIGFWAFICWSNTGKCFENDYRQSQSQRSDLFKSWWVKWVISGSYVFCLCGVILSNPVFSLLLVCLVLICIYMANLTKTCLHFTLNSRGKNKSLFCIHEACFLWPSTFCNIIFMTVKKMYTSKCSFL